MQFWYEFLFPLNIIFDLSNAIFISLIILFICRIYKITQNFRIICFLSCFTPFLFNGLIFDWTVFPDQSKYWSNTWYCRMEDCLLDIKNIPIFATNIFYSLTPVAFIEGFKSIAFANRFILILFGIYLYLIKFNKDFILILFFLPSIVLYSSLGLRDSLSIIISLLVLQFFFDKKYLYSLFFLLFFYAVKPHNAVIFAIILLCYQLLFNVKKSNKIYYYIIKNKFFFLFIGIILFFFIMGYGLEITNHKRIGFWYEHQNLNLDSIEAYSEGNLVFINFKNFPIIFAVSFFKFIISPIKEIVNTFGLILVIDTIVLYFITSYFFKKIYEKDIKKFYFWILSLIFICSIYSLVIFNDGTIHRYKLSIFIPIIFGIIKTGKLKSE